METIQMSSTIAFKQKVKIWAKEAGMSVSGFIRTACLYYVENVLPKLRKTLHS